MRVERLVAAAAAGVLLVGAGGCSGEDTTPVADDTGTASTAPSEVETSQDTEPVESEDPEEQAGGYDAEELLAAMKAAVEEHESAHLEMQIAGGGQMVMDAEGDVTYEGDSTAMRLVMESSQFGSGLELRMIGSSMYLSMPPLTPKGKFLEFDLDDPDNPFGELGGIAQGDPLASFEAFDAGLEEATYLGREEVDGEEMDHYVLTVDGRAAAKAQGSPPGSVPRTLTYDLWLDDQDLMRRMQSTLEGGGVTVTMSDWGKPVDVEAPPAGSIVEMPPMPNG